MIAVLTFCGIARANTRKDRPNGGVYVTCDASASPSLCTSVCMNALVLEDSHALVREDTGIKKGRIAFSPRTERMTGAYGDVCATLDASYYKGVGARNGRERPLAVSISNGQVGELNASIEECCQTLNCMHETQKVAFMGDL